MPSILEARNLVKKYGDFTAVNGISFEIKEGEIFNLLGPNGAGKTTTISMLSTLYVPTSGEATVGGHSITKEPMAVRNLIGVVPQGQVISYEVRPDMQNLARKNLERLGLDSRVDFKLADIADGFTETDVDAVFLDLPNPWDYVAQVRAALKPGGFFCGLLPTFNQVAQLLHALRREHFAFVEVCKLLLRYYKPEPARLRPTDRMVAHTGFLIFGRRVEMSEDERVKDLLEER